MSKGKKFSVSIKDSWEECPRREKRAIIVMLVISAMELVVSVIVWIK